MYQSHFAVEQRLHNNINKLCFSKKAFFKKIRIKKTFFSNRFRNNSRRFTHTHTHIFTPIFF